MNKRLSPHLSNSNNNNDDDDMLLELFTLALGATILIGVWTLYNGFIIVNEGEVIIIERMGKFSEVKHAGFHLIKPFIERPRVVHWTRRIEQPQPNSRQTIVVDDVFADFRIRTQNIVFDIPPVRCYTKERVQININIVVFYSIKDVQKAVYGVNDLYAGIELKVQTLLTSALFDLSIDDISTHTLQHQMSARLSTETWQSEWGLCINRFEIQDVELPGELSRATLNAVTQKRTMDSERLSNESVRFKQLSQLETDAMVAEKQREAELARARHLIETTRLDNEYQNERSRKQTETENLNVKSQQQLEAEKREMKYKAMATSGMSEQYFIERARSKSMEKIFHAGITGSNKTLIMPLEALTSNPLMTTRLVCPDASSTPIVTMVGAK